MTTRQQLDRLGVTVLLALAAQLLLGIANTLYLDVPARDSWAGARPAVLLYVHIGLGTVVLAVAAAIAVLAVRAGDRVWIAASLTAVLAVATAYAAGIVFLAGQEDAVSYVMAVGFTIAFTSYALALRGTAQPANGM